MGVYIIIGIIAAVSLSYLTVVILVTKKKKEKQGKNNILKKKSKPKNQYFKLSTYAKLSRWLENNFIFRQEFKNTRERLANMCLYTPAGIEINAVNSVVFSNVVFVVFIVMSAVLFRDVFAVMVMIVYSYVFKDMIVFKEMDKIHFKVLQELSLAISNVRQEYMKLGSIPDAILDAEVPDLLKGSFNSIYGILTSDNAQDRLEEFYATTPFRILQTFAGVCFIVNDTGDSKTSNSNSNFIEALSMISSEINLDIRKIIDMKTAFGVLEILPIVPIFALGLIETYFQKILPGVASMFRGPYGYVMRVVIILSSLLGYVVITKINSSNTTAKDDRNALCLKLLKFDWFHNIVRNIKPKRGKRLHKISKVIKGSLTCKTIEHIYGLKIIFATIGLLVSLVTCILAIDLGKSFIYSNYQELGLLAGSNLTASDLAKRVKMDAELLSWEEKPRSDKLSLLVEKYIPNIKDYEELEQVDRLEKKWDLYNSAKFEWWMVLICYAVAVGGWFVPDITLKARQWILSTEAEEDIMQLQTMIAILMNTSYDTLTVLSWLARQSRVHKNALIEAYHNYPSDPDMALEKLKNKAPSAAFHRMVDKLKLTISQIELKEAYSDLNSERDHIMRVREITQSGTIKKKRSKVSFLSLLPLVLVVIFYIILPIGVLGFQEFAKTMGSL